MVVNPVDIQFLGQINLQSCLRADDTGCMVVDRTSVISLLSAAKNTLQAQGSILTPAHAQQLSAETSYILGSCAVENHRRQVGFALGSCFEAWRRVVDVVLVQCFNRVPDNQQEHILLDLLQALPVPLRSSNTEEPTTIVVAEVFFTAMTKLREARFRDQQTLGASHAGSIPAERSYSLLRDLVGCLLDRKQHHLVRGNLYASLIHYLDMVATTEGNLSVVSLNGSKPQDPFSSSTYDPRQTFATEGSVAAGSWAILQPVLDRVVGLVSKDALNGAEVWKTVAFLLLDSLVQLPNSRVPVLLSLFQAGYLTGFVQSIGESDSRSKPCFSPIQVR